MPDLSLVVPCYNEEEVIEQTLPRLVTVFEDAGLSLDLIAVDNGSTDSTGAILAALATETPAIRPTRVERNEGYGNGILHGLALAHSPWIGIIPCDGQVDAEDVVRLYQAVVATDGWVVGKVRRRFRLDGLPRKVISVAYNLFVRMLWPTLGSIDVNGSPKILPRRILQHLALQSKDWLLDPEIMIKAHYAGLRVLELNVFARMRGGGTSHVRPSTTWLFVQRLLRARLTGEWRPTDLTSVTRSSAPAPPKTYE